MPMKLVSWNVNGLRACVGKGFGDFVAASGADVICLQEVRAHATQVEARWPGWTMHWNPALKPGYSGTAILTRRPPLAVFPGLGLGDHDGEGRVLTAEFEDLFVVTVYTPNAQRELTRLDYRCRQWDPEFLRFVKRLEKCKPVVFCGDLNVSHQEIDLANPAANRGNAGFTDEERAGFDRLLEGGIHRHVPRLRKRGRALLVVEQPQGCAGEEHRLAAGLLPGLGGPPPAPAGGRHPAYR
jgi:exodeoxyribonuclease-3